MHKILTVQPTQTTVQLEPQARQYAHTVIQVTINAVLVTNVNPKLVYQLKVSA